jgi:serine/threonine protein kinase
MAINLFSLGVATMHVASSGDRPYEEIFCEEEVFCPLALKADLILEWNKEGYSTIRTFLEVLGDDASTVFDTLYRYCVIFDLEENFVKRYKENAVVKLLVKHLKGEPSPTEVRQSARLKENAKKVIRKFENHRAQFGLCRDGLVQPRHPYFARVQSVLQESGGLDLLFRMCDFNPETRISLEDILQHEFLDCFRSDDESHDDTAGSDSDSDFSDADE